MTARVKAWGIGRILLAACLLSGLASSAHAQRPDSTARRSARDSAIVLNTVQVRASIAPVAGPSIGADVPARVSIIDSTTLRAWHTHLLTDAVARQSNISLYDDLGSPSRLTIGLRGFTVGPTVGTPAGVSVFVDGIRQNEPDAQEVNFDLLPMEMVDRIEILSGPASLLGANGLGGAINLITEHGGGAPRGQVELGGGSFGGRSADGSLSGSTAAGWNYLASGSHDRADGWRAATAWHSSRGFLSLGTGGDAGGVTLQAFGSEARAQTAGSLPESLFETTPRTNFTAGDVDELSMAQVSASGYTAVGGGRASATLYGRSSHADRFNVNQAPDDNVRGLTANTSEGVNLDWRRTFGVGSGALDLRVAGDGTADQVHVRLFDVPRASTNDSLATDVASPRLDLAGYATSDLRLGPATVSAGARYDYVRAPFDDRLAGSAEDVNVFRRLTPRAGVHFNLPDGASVYGSVGTSFRAPALLELGCADPDASCPLPFALGDDPPLKPVRATSYEVGVQSLSGVVLVRASVYRTDVRDEIFFVSSAASLQSGYFTNLDRTRRSGAELDVQGSFGDRLAWYAGGALTDATFQSPVSISSARAGNDVRPGDHLPLVPRNQLKGGVTLQLTTTMQLGLDAQRVGSQWLRGDEANQTRPLAPYSVLDGRWNMHPGDWTISVVGRNLLDTHGAVFGTFNENLTTGDVERFLTPHDARTISLSIGRSFGP
ncbi:MAG TPA: TonB-dependent receptor [Gemmatimonadaceae bacterium]|jgi:outer membrane receptor protein involved in Fe transport|nr:TonB-dependent receptor [Gemmatimonadaceae bacterium]